MPSEASRQRLLAEATRAFLTHGYGATNLDAIAAAAGISKKTIYDHVGSKAELFALVVENGIDQAPVGGLIAALDEDAPEPALRTLLLAVARLALSDGGLRFQRMLMREAATFPELVLAFDRLIAEFLGGLVKWLDRQKAAGRLCLDSAETAAAMLLNLLVADIRRDFFLGQRNAPELEEQVRLVDAALQIFLHGTLPRPDPQGG